MTRKSLNPILILPIAVLTTSIFALTAALLVVWWLASWEILLLSGQTQGSLFILVIGAATDYSLLYVARYREELRQYRDKATATLKATCTPTPPTTQRAGPIRRPATSGPNFQCPPLPQISSPRATLNRHATDCSANKPNPIGIDA